jgi:hypothetical protein
MREAPQHAGLVGLFWVVEDRARAVLIAQAVPMAQAVSYGDMLTVEMGHVEYWAALPRRCRRSLSADGIPSAPVWSEYEEWPRGRVLYDCTAKRFIIRADRQLLRPAFLRLVADRFDIPMAGTRALSDDHYRSIRHVPVPAGDDAGMALIRPHSRIEHRRPNRSG